MSLSGSSSKFGKGWSECKGTSSQTSMTFDFLQDKGGSTRLINLDRLLECVMKSRRGRSNAVKLCKDWTVGKVSAFHIYGDDCYFDSRELETIVTLLHSEHMINRDHVHNIIVSWKEIAHDFDLEGDNELEIVPPRETLPLYCRAPPTMKRKAVVVDDDDDDAFDPIEDVGDDEEEFDGNEDEAEDDLEEDFDVLGIEQDSKRPMEFEERERMIRLNCVALKSLTAAGAYLHSRSPGHYARTLDDIDASIINVSRELQRFVPVGSQQPIQVEDVLDDDYADKAVRLNRRARDLGHSLANLNQEEYKRMLKEVGIRASNLHRQVYGRKPKKVRMMSGSGSTSHFNYYSERTAPRTLDVAIREWFTNHARDAAYQEGMVMDLVEEEEEYQAPLPQKRPRLSMVQELEAENEAIAADQEEFDRLVEEQENACLKCHGTERMPNSTLCQACNAGLSIFSQFFGNI